MDKAIFLDMDGVIVDFMGGLHQALEIPYDPDDYPYTRKYDIFDEVVARSNGRHTLESLYEACNRREFWSNLAWDPMGKKIMAAVAKHPSIPVYICTSPMMQPEAWAGKVDWIQKHLKGKITGTIMTDCPKHLMAKKGHVLIDDKDSNVESFRTHGGSAFLVPQPWNFKHDSFRGNFIPDLESVMGSCLLS